MGCAAAGQLRRRLAALEELSRGLELLEGEMALHCPALEACMGELAHRAPGTAGDLFAAFSKSLSRLGEDTAAGLWRSAVEGLSDVSREGKDILLPLGEFLGRYSGEEQCRAIAGVRGRLEQLQRREETRCRENSRLCRALSLSGGAFLVILLL